MKRKNTYKRALEGHPKAVRKLTRLGVPLPNGAASGEALGLTVAPEAAPAQAPTAPALRLPIGFVPVLGPWKPTPNGVMRQSLFSRVEMGVWPEGGWEAGELGEPLAEGPETGDEGRAKADEWARTRFVLLEREPGSFAGTPRYLRCQEDNTWTVYNGHSVEVGWATETGWRLDDMHGPQGGKGPYDKNEGLRYLLTAAGAAGYTLTWAPTQEVPEHSWYPSAPLGAVK